MSCNDDVTLLRIFQECVIKHLSMLINGKIYKLKIEKTKKNVIEWKKIFNLKNKKNWWIALFVKMLTWMYNLRNIKITKIK